MTINASVSSPADVVNIALAHIGYRLRVASLFDGSEAASSALDIYGQTRDALLRSADWGFAEKVLITPSSTGNAPPAPWVGEYAYPTDCLKIRYVVPMTAFTDPFNPLPALYQIASNVVGAVQSKVIWTRVALQSMVYTQQVTNPQNWEPLFVEALVTELGKNLVPLLVKRSPEIEMKEEQMVVPLAEGTVG